MGQPEETSIVDDNKNLISENGKSPGDSGQSQEMPQPKMVPLKKLYKFITPREKCYLVIGTLASIFMGVALPAFALLFGGVIDEIAPGSTIDQIGDGIKQVSIVFFYVAVAIFFFGFLNFGLWMMVAERIGMHFREKYLEAVLRQDVEWFDTSNPAEIPSNLNTQCDQIKKGTGQKVAGVVMASSMFFSGIIVAFGVGWALALVLLGTAPLLVVSTCVLTKIAQKGYMDNMMAYAKAGGRAEQALSNLKTVAAFNGQEYEKEQYEVDLKATATFGKKNACKMAVGMSLFMFVMFVLYSFAVYIGGLFVIEEFETNGIFRGIYNGASVLTCFFGVIFGLFSLGMAMPNFALIMQAKAAGSLMFDVIEREPALNYNDYDKNVNINNLSGEIEMKNVKFCYPSRPDITVLDNFSFTFKTGKTTAIVGSTGSGKSTIIQLIERFYDPQGGQITIGGAPLDRLDIKGIRKNVIGYVGQEPVLFNMSIRENIRFGKEDATDEEIKKACQEANAWEFISSFPKGLDTDVGSMGGQLSGGQKQRIAIARATIRQPKILLLDEATSALDRKSEAIVQEALEKISHGRTTIVIAHRLTTIQNADTIIVLDKGKLAQEGNHNELLAMNGFYAKLVRGQMENKDDEQEEEEEEVEIEEKNGFLAGISKKEINELSSTPAKPRKTSDRTETAANPLLMQRKSSVHTGPKMSPQQRKLMEEVLDEEAKLTEQEMGIMMERSKKAGKVLCGISCENSFYIILGILCSILLGTSFPIFALVLADAVTGLNDLSYYTANNNPTLANQAEDTVNEMALYFLLLALGMLIIQFGQTAAFGQVSEHVTLVIRKMTFNGLLEKNVGWYDKPDNAAPAMVASLSMDTALLNSLTNTAIGALIQSAVSLVTGIVIGFIYSWRLSLVMLGLSPLMVMGGFMEAKMQTGFNKGMEESYKASTVIVSETVQNYRTVFSFANEGLVMKFYKHSLHGPYKTGVKKSLCSGFMFGISQCAQYFCYGLSFYVAGVFIAEDLLPQNNMFKAVFALMFGAYGAGQAQSFAPDMGAGKAAAGKIFRVINEPSRINPFSKEGMFINKINGRIEFKNVWFKYPTRDEWILRGVSFVIEPGRTVALVGQSGCGKSTCIQLLERFYDIQRGQILLDGVNIKDLNLNHYRHQISLVSQEPTLFNSSIKENIIYGQRDSTMKQVREAAKDANALEFIERLGTDSGDGEKGFYTNVGTKGSQLSGGQKQRVAIARAIIKKPKVLLLDEATSALDKESEAIVQQALDRVMVNQTSIVIAHRLSTIENVDCIMVLKEGKVVEKGRFNELMDQKGEFFTIATGDKSKV